MNIVYSCDDGYCQHLGASIYSLYSTHKNIPSLNVYVISENISSESKKKVELIAYEFSRRITWIDFEKYKNQLVLDMEWKISISSYARLFLSEMLPPECEKVIYLDCDTIIAAPLEELFNMDLMQYSIAAVEDTIPTTFKIKIGLDRETKYFNAGVLLIDLTKWRSVGMEKVFLNFINKRNGKVTHHDQGVINGVFRGEILSLHPKYNAITPFFTFKYGNMIDFFDLHHYYSKKIVKEAQKEPIIIHYTPEFVGRPWNCKCAHPKTKLYRLALRRTPWGDTLQKGEELSLKQRLVYWMYKKLPVPIINVLLKRD